MERKTGKSSLRQVVLAGPRLTWWSWSVVVGAINDDDGLRERTCLKMMCTARESAKKGDGMLLMSASATDEDRVPEKSEAKRTRTGRERGRERVQGEHGKAMARLQTNTTNRHTRRQRNVPATDGQAAQREESTQARAQAQDTNTHWAPTTGRRHCTRDDSKNWSYRTLAPSVLTTPQQWIQFQFHSNTRLLTLRT